MAARLSLSSACEKPLKFALAQQLVAFMATALLLDGGFWLRHVLFGLAAHWTLILILLVRRPQAPTRFDLGLIRFGFVPVALLAWVLAGLLGRGYAS